MGEYEDIEDLQEVKAICEASKTITLTKDQLIKVSTIIFKLIMFIMTLISICQDYTDSRQKAVIIEQNQQDALQNQELIDTMQNLIDTYEVLINESEHFSDVEQPVIDSGQSIVDEQVVDAKQGKDD